MSRLYSLALAIRHAKAVPWVCNPRPPGNRNERFSGFFAKAAAGTAQPFIPLGNACEPFARFYHLWQPFSRFRKPCNHRWEPFNRFLATV